MAAIKIGPKFKELRFLLCQTSKSSEGVRKFIQENYVDIKKANPKLPVLVRECSSIDPKCFIRGEYGKEQCIALTDLKSDEIKQKILQAVSS